LNIPQLALRTRRTLAVHTLNALGQCPRGLSLQARALDPRLTRAQRKSRQLTVGGCARDDKLPRRRGS